MTSSELRELVKSHFSLVEAEETIVEETLVEETFGRIADEDESFIIEFPGDSMQVGDKVTVVTPDDQKLDAPDGEHKLIDGTKIVTKDSVITEIEGADGEKALSEEKMTEESKETVTEEFDARTDAEEEGYLDGIKDEKADEKEAMMDVKDIVEAIVSEVKDEMAKMKQKMAELETTVAKVMDVPAAEATQMSSKPAPKAKFNTFNVETANNAARIKATMAQLKNKNK
tara:strand:- start:456 stop:1139 length:684 start_codon:yes stop_codon:yes gene_type:complete